MGAESEASGAGERGRTADLPLTRRLLCQLSYAGTHEPRNVHAAQVYPVRPRAGTAGPPPAAGARCYTRLMRLPDRVARPLSRLWDFLRSHPWTYAVIAAAVVLRRAGVSRTAAHERAGVPRDTSPPRRREAAQGPRARGDPGRGRERQGPLDESPRPAAAARLVHQDHDRAHRPRAGARPAALRHRTLDTAAASRGHRPPAGRSHHRRAGTTRPHGQERERRRSDPRSLRGRRRGVVRASHEPARAGTRHAPHALRELPRHAPTRAPLHGARPRAAGPLRDAQRALSGTGRHEDRDDHVAAGPRRRGDVPQPPSGLPMG